MMSSKAWFALRGRAHLVFSQFMLKRRLEKQGKKGHEKWVIVNAKELVFTYKQAEAKGISKDQFCYAIEELIRCGFIDIEQEGSGTCKGACTLYGLSDRWMKFGTAEFVEKKRQKQPYRQEGLVGACKNLKRKPSTEPDLPPENRAVKEPTPPTPLDGDSIDTGGYPRDEGKVIDFRKKQREASSGADL